MVLLGDTVVLVFARGEAPAFDKAFDKTEDFSFLAIACRMLLALAAGSAARAGSLAGRRCSGHSRKLLAGGARLFRPASLPHL